MLTPLTRTAVAGLAACAVLALTACGDGDDAATVTTIAIRPESYALKPPATPPSTAPAVPIADAEGRRRPSRATRSTRTSTPSRSPPCSTSSSTRCATSTAGRPTTRTSRAPAASSASRRAPSSSTRPPRRPPSPDRTSDDGRRRRARRRPAPAAARTRWRRATTRSTSPRSSTSRSRRCSPPTASRWTAPATSPGGRAVGTEIQLPAGPDCTATTHDHASPPADPVLSSGIGPIGPIRKDRSTCSQPRSGQRRVGGRRQAAMPWRRFVVRSHCRRQPV